MQKSPLVIVLPLPHLSKIYLLVLTGDKSHAQKHPLTNSRDLTISPRFSIKSQKFRSQWCFLNLRQIWADTFTKENKRWREAYFLCPHNHNIVLNLVTVCQSRRELAVTTIPKSFRIVLASVATKDSGSTITEDNLHPNNNRFNNLTKAWWSARKRVDLPKIMKI